MAFKYIIYLQSWFEQWRWKNGLFIVNVTKTGAIDILSLPLQSCKSQFPTFIYDGLIFPFPLGLPAPNLSWE